MSKESSALPPDGLDIQDGFSEIDRGREEKRREKENNKTAAKQKETKPSTDREADKANKSGTEDQANHEASAIAQERDQVNKGKDGAPVSIKRKVEPKVREIRVSYIF